VHAGRGVLLLQLDEPELDVLLTRPLAALVVASLALACAGAGQPDVCDQSPPFPLMATWIPGPPASEDFTFDGDGYLLALESSRSLVRVARGALPTLVVPNVVANGRGLRMLPGGDVVIADQDRSLLVRVDRAGATRRLTTTIGNPNGLALGPGGQLYATDFGTTGEVFRVDPDSGAALPLARLAAGANGLTFSPDYGTLHVGDHDTGALYRLRLEPDGGVKPAERWAGGLGQPDGLATDRCGNVYAASWDHRVYQVSPAGGVQVVAELPSTISAVGFGSGRQGWSATSLYAAAIQEGGVYEIDLGLTAPPPP
jgi:hypothetical protein